MIEIPEKSRSMIAELNERHELFGKRMFGLRKPEDTEADRRRFMGEVTFVVDRYFAELEARPLDTCPHVRAFAAMCRTEAEKCRTALVDVEGRWVAQETRRKGALKGNAEKMAKAAEDRLTVRYYSAPGDTWKTVQQKMREAGEVDLTERQIQRHLTAIRNGE